MPAKKDKSLHKKRIVFLIPPEQFDLVTESDAKIVSKEAITKEYKKRLKSQKQCQEKITTMTC